MNTNLADIIRRAREGEIDAFQQIHEQYGRRILNFVYRMVESWEDAEDLTQNVFLIVFNELGRLQDEQRFESWLYRIARNEVYQEFRKRRGKAWGTEASDEYEPEDPTKVQLADERPTPQERILRQELGSTIGAVLRSLPPKLREVFVLAVMHERSYAEISDIVGRSLLSVKTDIYRARSHARKALSAYLEPGRVEAKAGKDSAERVLREATKETTKRRKES